MATGYPPVRAELKHDASVLCTPQRVKMISLHGKNYDSPHVPVSVAYESVGSITVSSGALIVCDPMLMSDGIRYTQPVTPGAYPVEVLRARFPDGDWRGTRNALAILRLSAEAPVTWRMAMRPDESERQLARGERFGFGVDSACACIVDASAAIGSPLLDADWFDRVSDVGGGTAAIIPGDPALGADLFVCTSGLGDGLYSSYWGFDVAGKLACLVIDFDLVEVSWPTGRGRWWQRFQ